MLVLRPSSVSTGCTDRQLLFTPQSPQPSHTASLITTRGGRTGLAPALRPRAASAPRRGPPRVDHDAGGAHGDRAPLAQTARLGRAALVVDQHGDAGRLGEHALGVVEALAGPERDPGRQRCEVAEALRLVGTHDDLRDALG